MVKKHLQIRNEIWQLISKYYHPELGLDYLSLKPALTKYCKKKFGGIRDHV
ncbi:hypothetical protein LCGC14_0380780 [marine sediment metagenome]|uniref:Uncharacterized protein n=1 Tax=marine sediment metagenome TaxID=412755 RepID=A0A0F9TKP3_9ZZZZ